MESIVRNVRDLDAGNWQSLETILGRRLGDDQRVIEIQRTAQCFAERR